MLPGLAGALGLGAVVVGAGDVGEALAVRLAVGAAVVGATLVWPLALGLDRGKTTRSGPQAPNATTATDIKMAR